MYLEVVGTQRVTSNVALIAGSSQHGKARRAPVASKCVTARGFLEPSPAEKTYLLYYYSMIEMVEVIFGVGKLGD